MSARISGVKNFESKAASLVRGLPFSQVQSQSEKGTIFSFLSFLAGASSGDCTAGVDTAREDGIDADRPSSPAFAGAALVAVAGTDAVAPGLAKSAAAADCSAADFSAALRAFSSASNCSMRSFIASSSLASASFSAILFGASAGLALLVLLSGAAASRAGRADGG